MKTITPIWMILTIALIGCDAVSTTTPVPTRAAEATTSQRDKVIPDPVPKTATPAIAPKQIEPKQAEPAPVTSIPEEEMEPAPLPAPPVPPGLKPLNMAKTLFIENRPEGRRLWILAEIVNRDVPLEVFMCRKMTKEHEAIVAADLDARDVHTALLVIGAKPGKTVQFVPNYVPALGEKIRVLVHYMKDGKPVTHPAQEWILDQQTKKPMTHEWVFAGSRFLKDPDNPNAQPYYAANNGEIISVSNFVDSMLDIPVESSREEVNLAYRTLTDKIPPRKSPIYVILERVEKK